ncbi:hypothetical protein LK542_19590 [Massilia sp. IC2-477]|uniref:hypothetical protein n=1 Tax=unclassified Massilia TaxID=2609279 RepID=UPI001D12DE7F|nr:MULTISPECIES: hypothetical protein [unclassified Massilia]MCC2957827.1 hypothetical protein [Massilia sp. IC2-477]MCC2974120.1 hypothetical protein [Massilia sp. IC2-476]
MKPVYRFVLATLVALPLAVQAAEPEKLPVKISFLTEVKVAPEREAADAWGEAASTERLGRTSGKDDTVHTEAVLGGTVGNNTAVNTVSGNNVIDSGSFANAQGIPMVIQNSGSNVLIQSATVINLRLQ